MCVDALDVGQTRTKSVEVRRFAERVLGRNRSPDRGFCSSDVPDRLSTGKNGCEATFHLFLKLTGSHMWKIEQPGPVMRKKRVTMTAAISEGSSRVLLVHVNEAARAKIILIQGLLYRSPAAWKHFTEVRAEQDAGGSYRPRRKSWVPAFFRSHRRSQMSLDIKLLRLPKQSRRARYVVASSALTAQDIELPRRAGAVLRHRALVNKFFGTRSLTRCPSYYEKGILVVCCKVAQFS